MTHDFLMAITAVFLIVILALVLVQCINKQYRRDFEYDYLKQEQLFERCLTQKDLIERRNTGARDQELKNLALIKKKQKEIEETMRKGLN